MQLQQMQVLLALESDLLAALETAQSAHDETLATMETARQTLAQLFRNEATATKLYVDDTRLRMRAIRDLAQLEMDRAHRDVATMLQHATRNATHVRAAYAHQKAATREKMEALRVRKRQREAELREAIERVTHETAATAKRLEQDMYKLDELSVHVPPQLEIPRDQHEPLWMLPFLVSLVMCAILWLVVSTVRERRARDKRRKRVLYSEQLQSHFANANQDPKVDEEEEAPRPKPEIARKPTTSHDHRPTLRRRLRPGWSPAASTASTVSSPETASSIFASHAAFESVTPSPF